jgi:hypothetical protein
MAEMRFLGGVSGYRMADHKRNEDNRGELGITGINTVIKELSKEMARSFSRKT